MKTARRKKAKNGLRMGGHTFPRVVAPCDVPLPHIDYTIRLRWKDNPKDPDSSTDLPNAHCFIRFDGRTGSTIYVVRDASPMSIAHEMMHAIQHICRVRNMLIEREEEHLAYIMQHAMGLFYGLVWEA